MDRTRTFSAVLAVVFVITTGSALAVAPPGGPQNRFTVPHVPAQLIVKRAPGTPLSAIDDLLGIYGAVVLASSVAAQLEVVGIDDDADLEAAVLAVEADPRFEFAEPNYTAQLWATPNDLDFPQQWSKENTGINAPSGLGNPGADMNMPSAWDTQSSAPGVILAVIDDSLETTHLDLAANVMPTGRCFASPNSTRPCSNGPNDPNPTSSEEFHGTLVAGAAAARGNNGIGVAGVVWEANILALKVDLSAFAIVDAIDEAIAQGAHIINMSFGGPVQSQAQAEALGRAEAAGILIVASAGNADANNDTAAHYPSDSDHPNVLSVAATDARDRVARFSQWGPMTVDLAAPGDLIRTTANDNGFAVVSGTSFSAPHVAGVAALVQAATAAADYRQLKAHLLFGTVNGTDALGPVTPGQDKEAVPGRVATDRLDAAKALSGPAGGVPVITAVNIDDSATGNGNGALDPGETALLEITLSNVWADELNVTGTLSTADSAAISVNDITPKSFGSIIQDGVGSASFSVTLSNGVVGNEQLFMQLDLASSSSGALPTRYFFLEVGSLADGTVVSQAAQRYDWDEFQAFHIDVPVGATQLTVSTTGSGDLDLLLRRGRSPEYLISLNGGFFYYVDSETVVSAEQGADESISLASPLPGTYHVVVVNFDQQPKQYSLSADYTLPAAGEIAFSAATYAAAEDSADVLITVTRSGAVGAASVDYATIAQTATAGQDYVSTTGTLAWGVGENGDKTFAVTILDDQDVEATETLELSLANPSGGALASPSTATLSINDNDDPGGVLAFEQASYTVVEGSGALTVLVSRSGGSSGTARADFQTQPGDAVAGLDYATATGSVTWASGETGSKAIQLSILDDTDEEEAEQFQIALLNPQGASVGSPSVASVMIDDDDESSTPGSNGAANSGGGASGVLLLFVLLLALARPSRRRVTTAGSAPFRPQQQP